MLLLRSTFLCYLVLHLAPATAQYQVTGVLTGPNAAPQEFANAVLYSTAETSFVTGVTTVGNGGLA